MTGKEYVTQERKLIVRKLIKQMVDFPVAFSVGVTLFVYENKLIK
jgi:hypothetical protein